MIRRKSRSYDLTNYIQPNLENLDGTGIQNAIKSRIDRQQLFAFLDRKMSEDTIPDFQSIMDTSGSFYEGITESKRKYLFDLVLAVMYEELMSFNDIRALVATGDGSIDILERMIVLEYDLYFLEYSIGTTQEFDKVYIIDNVKDIFHGTEEKMAYKDLDNLQEELDKILNSASKPTEIPSDFYTSGTDFNPNLLFRINRKVADIELDNIAKYSFLLNYNTTSSVNDRALLRKYWAIQANGTGRTYGYYYKDSTKKYLTGLNSYSYYGLLSSSYNSSYKAAHDFLTDLWDRMRDGTINY